MYSSNLIGVILACVSSAFIGSSFIIKKKGLKRAGASGPRASIYLSLPFFCFKFILYYVLFISEFHRDLFQHLPD